MRCTCALRPGPIDVHTHFLPATLPAAAGGAAPAGWPSLEHPPACGHGLLRFGDGPPRRVLPALWDSDTRLRAMADERIGVQVLSPLPDLFGYTLPPRAGADLCRHVNDALAAVVAQGDGAFLGLGMLPLQDLDLALQELERIARELPLEGIEIGSHIAGVSPGDRRWDPLYAALERHGLALFIHPAHPAGADRVVGMPELVPLITFPNESALAAASLVSGGVLERFPQLHIAISHCGGGFAAVLPRLQHAWANVPAVRESMATAPAVAARRLFYDTLTLAPGLLRHAIASYGADRLLLGSDYPFPIGDRLAVHSLEAAVEDVSVREGLLRGNALTFLQPTFRCAESSKR